jgi:hypothetical protein
MKRFIVITAMTIMLSVLFCNHAMSSGYIKGQLTDGGIKYFDGVNVTFFNSENAEIISSTISDGNGYFVSLPLPVGKYKIHFDESIPDSGTCIDEFFGQHLNVFDTGIAITVRDNQKTDLGIVTVFNGGILCMRVLCKTPLDEGTIMGYVIDSSTKNPIPSIKVQFKNPITAFPNFNEVTTDLDGFFILQTASCGALEAKVRFYDPKGIYSAEYYGSGGVDNFSKGSSVTFINTTVQVDEDLALLSPAEQIGNIIEDVQTILPVQDAQPVVSSLLQGKALLEDTNPNNDKGACGILTGAANKINVLVSSGRLSQTAADALIASIDALKIDLGCSN